VVGGDGVGDCDMYLMILFGIGGDDGFGVLVGNGLVLLL